MKKTFDSLFELLEDVLQNSPILQSAPRAYPPPVQFRISIDNSLNETDLQELQSVSETDP